MKINISRIAMVAGFGLLMTGNVGSAKPVSKMTAADYSQKLLRLSPTLQAPLPLPSESETQAAASFAETKKGFRVPASDISSLMTAEFQGLQDRLMKATTNDQLALLIEEVEAGLDSGSLKEADSRFFASQLLILKPFRGFAYRLRALAEKNHVTHSFMLTQIKSAYAFVDFYFPERNHWQSGFDYVTQPFIQKSVDGGAQNAAEKRSICHQFTDEAELQAYFANEVQNTLDKIYANIYKVDFRKSAKIPGFVVWDNSLIYNSTGIQRSVDRYRLAGDVEKYALMANIYRAKGQIEMNRSYMMNGHFDVTYQIGRLYGVDGFLSNEVDGVPEAKTVQIYKKFPDYGVEMPDARVHMARALVDFQSSVVLLRKSWDLLKTRESNERYMIDGVLSKFFQETSEKSVANLEAILGPPPSSAKSNASAADPSAADSKTTVVTSNIRSGKDGAIKVNVPMFFENPPHDLHAFLSQSWLGYDARGNRVASEFTSVRLADLHDPSFKIDGVQMRNYALGKPVSWNLSAYESTAFPEVKSDEDLKRHVRVLTESWGGWLAGLPFTQYVY